MTLLITKYTSSILCRSRLQQQRYDAALYMLCLLFCESGVIGLDLTPIGWVLTIRAHFEVYQTIQI